MDKDTIQTLKTTDIISKITHTHVTEARVQQTQLSVCVCLTIHKRLCFATVCEHEVILSVAKLLRPTSHEYIIIAEEILQTGHLTHTNTHRFMKFYMS